MRFPDTVKILRDVQADEYGNPRKSRTGAASTTLQGFLVTDERLLLPPAAQVARGDRVEARSRIFLVGNVDEIRSPAKTVLWSVTVKEIPR